MSKAGLLICVIKKTTQHGQCLDGHRLVDSWNLGLNHEKEGVIKDMSVPKGAQTLPEGQKGDLSEPAPRQGGGLQG